MQRNGTMNDKTIVKKMLQAIKEDVSDNELLELARLIQILLGFEAPRKLILEYIGEEY